MCVLRLLYVWCPNVETQWSSTVMYAAGVDRLEEVKTLREPERERWEKEELVCQNVALQTEKEKVLREQENESQSRLLYCVSICTFFTSNVDVSICTCDVTVLLG